MERTRGEIRKRDFKRGDRRAAGVTLVLAYVLEMQPIEQSYNREGKGLHGHNLQREHDTGGTPAAEAGHYNIEMSGKI